MTHRLLACFVLLAATACASANRNANGSSGPYISVRNESASTIELYVTEGADGKNLRRVTKVAPSETYKYRGPVPAPPHFVQFSGRTLNSGVTSEPTAWVPCYGSPTSVVCK
jgi:hypothetical protein